MKTKKLTYSFIIKSEKRNNVDGHTWLILTAQFKVLVNGWTKGRRDVATHSLQKAIFRLNKAAGYSNKPWHETATELRDHMKKDPLLQGSEREETQD